MKKTIKILSVIMAVLIFLSVFSASTTVFAEEYNRYVENKAYKQKLLTETVDNGTEKAEILYEVREKREEFSKTYLRADGSYTKILSNTPLHIKKNNKWENIDNRLVAEDKENIIKNRHGKFEIEFPETITENDKITVESGGESIAFSVNDIKSSDGTISPLPTENADIITEDLFKTVSGITYEDVGENTDVQYVVSPVSVKENIIVHDKKSLKETYSFDIEKGDLAVTLDNENNVLFKNEKSRTVFTIPAPVMTDDNNDISYDIEVTVENSEAETITLSYTPSKEWLNASNRVYPVVIDPIITFPDFDDTVIQDTAIISDTADSTTRTTNYSDSVNGLIADYASIKANVLIKLDMEMFSCFKQPNIEITDVNYFGNGYIIGGNALVKPITGEWDCETITYDDVFPGDSTSEPVITYENKIIDYYTGVSPDTADPQSTGLCFNITSLFKEWLSGERENAGFAIVPENSSTYGAMCLAGVYTTSNNSTYTFNTYCSIDYVDTSCTNDVYEYLTQEIGRAGTASVNTFSRGLSLTRSDISMDGLLMPVSVEFNYNCSFNTALELYNSLSSLQGGEDIVLPYGNNWLPSYFRMLIEITDGEFQYFTGEGTLVTFTEIVEFNTDEETGETTKTTTFEPDATGDVGYELELIDQSEYPFFENLRITTPSGEFVHFDENGFITEIIEPEANSDGSSDKITVSREEYNPLEIDYVVDGAGRKFDFAYNDETGVLSEITCLTSGGVQIKAGTTDSDLKISYTYDENRNLTSVTYSDGKTVTYTYDSNGNLVKATNIDGYNISYTYDSLKKVTMITERAGAVTGNIITLEGLVGNQVKITDDYLGTEIHQFGNDGKLQYIFDDDGNYQKSENAQSNDETIEASYGWNIEAENLLKNGSFEKLSDSKADFWTNSFNTVNVATIDSTTDYACKVSGTTQQKQTVSVNSGKNYTFSIYAKDCSESGIENRGFDIQITVKDSDGNSVSKTQRIIPVADFEQYSVSVSSDTNVKSVTVAFGGSETNGEFLVNNAQLEKGNGTAKYNYIENGQFCYVTDNAPNNWSSAKVVSKTLNNDSINAVTLSGGLPYYTKDGTEYILNDSVSAVTQNVKINGKKGEIYSVGGWFNGAFDDNYINPKAYEDVVDFQPQLTTGSAQIKVTYSYTETVTDDAGDETEQTVTESFAVDFQPHNKGWQYAVDSFALKGDTETVDVTVITKNIISDSYATKLELTKDSESSIIEEEETEEAVEEELCSCGCEECAYGENCPCTGAVDEKCQCPECLREDTSTEDSFGNTLSNKSFDGVNYIETLSSYTADGNYSATFTDENGNVTTYDYNTLNGILKSITSPVGVGTDTTTTSYTYDAMGNVLTVSTDVSNTEKQTLQYVYNNDLLTEIITPNGKYEIIYDVWGQVLSVSIIATNNIETKIPLVQYTYNSGAKRTQILTATYTNSSTNNNVYAYTYDDSGNIVNIKLNNSDKHIITYDNLGGLTEIKNVGGRTVQYNDDGVKIYDPDGNLIYQSLIGETGLEAEENYGISYRELEGEHKYDAGTGSSTDISGIEIAEEYRIKQEAETDWFGREASHVTTIYDISEESDVNPAEVKGKISTEYEYPEADGGKTSSTLEKYVNKTYNGSGTDVHIFDGYYYEYDKQNKISAEKTLNADGTTTDKYSYEYDKLGQLVRFNDAVENKTYIYSYDSNGNILSKTEYAYTLADELGTATNTTTYGYDTQWKDKLVSVGDQTITYDNIGNPTSYLGATLTWEGRNLSSYEDETRTVQYEYDENGMRYRAIVTNKEDGQGGSFEYVWVDGKLISTVFVSDGSTQTAKYLYNDFDEPVGMVVTNEDKTFSTYYYLKNAQGDITNIVSAYGGKMVEFTYDAFGNQSVHYQSNPSTMVGIVLRAEQIIVHALTPFGYRGYCYDQYTGLYYLQSRYYDPTTGRFINADDTNYLNATGTVLGCNLFAYCENDPVNGIDPSGETKINISSKFKKSGNNVRISLFLTTNLKNIKKLIETRGLIYSILAIVCEVFTESMVVTAGLKIATQVCNFIASEIEDTIDKKGNKKIVLKITVSGVLKTVKRYNFYALWNKNKGYYNYCYTGRMLSIQKLSVKVDIK